MHYLHNTKLAAFTLALMFAAAPAAHAAAITPSVSEVVARQGSTFSVRYAVEPQGEAVYTVRMNVRFPQNLVRLVSFDFVPGVVPLPQPGYDEINNAAGTFIKTGGYPRGAAGTTIFGTATFSVVGEGEGVITLLPESLVLNASDADVLTSYPSASVRIRGSAPAAQPAAQEPLVTVPGPSADTAVAPPVLFDVIAAGAPEPEAPQWWIVIALFIAFLLGLIVGRWFLLFAARRRRKKKDES